MEKPLTLKIQEVEEKLINILNESNLPAYCMKKMLEDIYKQIDSLDIEQVKQYIQEQQDKEIVKESEK